VWLRPLDTARLLSSRRSVLPGTVVLEVVDRDGWASGTWRWSSGPDGAECEPTSARAEVTLTAEGLGAALLGGTPALDLRAGGHLREHASGAVARLDGLLHWPRAPWTNTWF